MTATLRNKKSGKNTELATRKQKRAEQKLSTDEAGHRTRFTQLLDDAVLGVKKK